MIRLEETAESYRYVYKRDANPEAELVFSKPDQSSVVIEHTQVPEVYRGQGIGLLLLEMAVSEARNQGRKITPKCSYAIAQFQRHPEWKDVVLQTCGPTARAATKDQRHSD